MFVEVMKVVKFLLMDAAQMDLSENLTEITTVMELLIVLKLKVITDVVKIL